MANLADRHPHSRRNLIAYRVALVGITAIVGAFSLQSYTARLLAKKAPDIALRISPRDGIAAGNKAATILSNGLSIPADLRDARRYAERALDVDLTRDDAIFTVAATPPTSQQEARATLLVQQAEKLSRRNLAVQLWLIESAVRKGSVPAALRHFDIALRTNRTAGALLFPVLRSALEDSELLLPIARMVNAAPWREQFLQFAVSINKPSVALARVFAVQTGLAPFQATDLKGAFVAQLFAAGQYDAARRLAVRTPALVQDPHFAGSTSYAPFAWQLSDHGQVTAERLQDGNNSFVEIRASDSASGAAATQSLRAPPGRYILSINGRGETAGLTVQLACAKPNQELVNAPVRGRIAVTVAIPNGCEVLTLSLLVAAGDGQRTWQVSNVDLIPN
jgi:hypothetical protein